MPRMGGIPPPVYEYWDTVLYWCFLTGVDLFQLQLSTSTNNQKKFLHILVGLSCACPDHLGFDESILWEKDGKKHVLVAWHGDPADSAGEVVLDKIIFISDALHGCGTTIWAGLLYPLSSQPRQEPRQIVVKDSWINPPQKFTEGSILAKLNEAGVRGVPKLLHKQQVTGPHPSHPNIKVNRSTHFLRTLLSDISIPSYHIRVLSRLLTEPLGKWLMDFSSLAELLVAFIDYVLSGLWSIYLSSANWILAVHKDTIDKANILHRDISLLNLLLIGLDDDSSFDFVIHSHLSPETHQSLLHKLQRISHWGLLADWGYAVPLYAVKPPSPVDATTPAFCHQPTSAVVSSSPLTPFTIDETPTSPVPVPDDLDETVVPVRYHSFHGGSASTGSVSAICWHKPTLLDCKLTVLTLQQMSEICGGHCNSQSLAVDWLAHYNNAEIGGLGLKFISESIATWLQRSHLSSVLLRLNILLFISPLLNSGHFDNACNSYNGLWGLWGRI